MPAHQHRRPRRARLGQLAAAPVTAAAYYADRAEHGSLRLQLVDVQLELPQPLVAALAALVSDGSVEDAMPADIVLPDGELPWHGTIMLTDTDTGDGRHFESAGGSTRDLPLPLMANLETTVGHDGAFLAGRIDSITLGSPDVTGAGVFADTPEARLVAAHIAARNIRGISVDLDDVIADYEAIEYDAEGFPIDYLFRATQWRIMGATITPFPAFAEAFVELDLEPAADGAAAATDASQTAPVLVAAGGPARPPRDWFTQPAFDALADGAPTYLDSGQCYGYLAAFGECHIAFEDACTCAPRSAAQYAYACTGALVTAEGDTVAVGQLTMATGHADLSMSARAAASHYDDTGTAFADVIFGEDDRGIWFAGAMRPDLSEEQLRTIRCSALSGDWRPIGGSLELVAALAVNVPGFPIPRARVAGGQQTALVASAGGSVMARVVEQQHELVPRADFDALAARLDDLEQRVGVQLGVLEPEVRARLRDRIG